MSRWAIAIVVLQFAALARLAHAAEDHSAHQQPQTQPQSDEHGRHAEEKSAPSEESSQSNESEHAGHESHRDKAPTESELRHVPPLPPQHPMPEMSNERMIELMEMDDTAAFGKVLLDQLEWRDIDGNNGLFWDGQAWYGRDFNKLWFKSEGERVAGESEARIEALWDHIFARWWSVQTGVRHDLGEGPERTWAAFGVQGLAPHWFEVEATLYVGEQGRTAAIFSGEYEVLLTQRLILQPKIELNLYGKDDPENGIGSGLSEGELALRLRYEIRREFAPYLGVTWTHLFGNTADLGRAAGRDASDVQVVAGLRIWF
jgi:copper resistance protein B